MDDMAADCSVDGTCDDQNGGELSGIPLDGVKLSNATLLEETALALQQLSIGNRFPFDAFHGQIERKHSHFGVKMLLTGNSKKGKKKSRGRFLCQVFVILSTSQKLIKFDTCQGERKEGSGDVFHSQYRVFINLISALIHPLAYYYKIC